MKRITDKILLVLFVAAAGFFLFESFGIAKATLIESEKYDSQFEMYDIGVTLYENGEKLVWRDYNGEDSENPWDTNDDGVELFSAIDEIRYGEIYDEVLTVKNSGQVDEYVRVTIYKYWEDAQGNKLPNLRPELIVLNLVTNGNWIIDEDYSTPERTVLYYKVPLKGAESEDGPETTEAFMTSMMIDPLIKQYYDQETEEDPESHYTTITITYRYNGKRFCTKVAVDAIQTHNAEDASLSAWGRQIKIDETTGELSLVKEDKD
ncbi:MAG: hypothetical protein IJJ00_07455 [Erysipelotrichaceae bacterium]|nr:hypothetical protein [Erysipelotrichaceae bacterium]